MDKVLSTIKSLQYASSIQVNVEEEGTEVVHSGHGCSHSVKIEETDASKNAAEDPNQDINNRSKSDEEDREPPVHDDHIVERKRKSSADSDASTTPQTRKKAKTVKDTSTQQSKTSFDERCNQLLRFYLQHTWRFTNFLRPQSRQGLWKWYSLPKKRSGSLKTAIKKYQP